MQQFITQHLTTHMQRNHQEMDRSPTDPKAVPAANEEKEFHQIKNTIPDLSTQQLLPPMDLSR